MGVYRRRPPQPIARLRPAGKWIGTAAAAAVSQEKVQIFIVG